MVGISFDYPHELGEGFDRLNTAKIVRTGKNFHLSAAEIELNTGRQRAGTVYEIHGGSSVEPLHKVT
jgi:hypothetical protein